ncbi:MAG: hypothetical protein AB1523_09235 [Bacillota bacterium]
MLLSDRLIKKQQGIPAQDIENLMDAQGMTFGEVIKAINSLNISVKSLSDSVSSMKWLIPTIVGTGIAIIGVIVALK